MKRWNFKRKKKVKAIIMTDQELKAFKEQLEIDDREDEKAKLEKENE